MRTLEEAIDQIHRWMHDHAPHREALLQPPLTRQQIDDLVGATQVLLPEEAYTLYEWRNGIADRQCLFPGYQFNLLPEALEDLGGLYHDEYLRGPDEHVWLFIFQVQYTWGGYALFCDAKPRLTAPVDYDAMDAATDSLADLVAIVADLFESGAIVVDEEGELDFADRFPQIRLDPQECYRRVIVENWESISQAVLRIGIHMAAYYENVDLALDNSLRMFRNPSSRIWREPLILKDLMLNLNFSTRAEAHEMMAQLLQHSDRRIRWRAATLVGNSQYFHQYDWVRPLAAYFAEELAQPELPAPYRANLILSFGKTGDRRAIPLLKELEKYQQNMIGAVARMCLERVNGLSV